MRISLSFTQILFKTSGFSKIKLSKGEIKFSKIMVIGGSDRAIFYAIQNTNN